MLQNALFFNDLTFFVADSSGPRNPAVAEQSRAPFLPESNTLARTVAERILGAGRMAEDLVFLDYTSEIGIGMAARAST